LIIFAYPAFSQEEHYALKQVAVEQGLSQSTIHCLYRDHLGRLWLGTRNGLNCYDGVQMKTYFHNPNEAGSLPDNYIFSITQDRNNTLWIGTGKGVVRYNEDRDAFVQNDQQPNADSFLYSNFYHKGDSLLFVTSDHISIYEPSQNKISKVFFKGTESIPNEFVIQEWNDQILLASRWSKLFIFDIETGELTSAPFFDETEILALTKDHQNNLWLSVFKKGLFVIAPSGELIARFTTSNSALKNDYVLAINEVRPGEIWVGTDGGGIQGIHLRDMSFFSIPIGMAGYPELNSVSAIYTDEFENIWLGTINGGAFFLKEVIATSFSDVSWNNTNGLSGNTVLSIFVSNEEEAWIGTDGGGLNKYSLKDGLFKHYPNTKDKKVNAIIGLSEQELLINCFAEGLKIFNKKTGRLADFPLKLKGENANVLGSGYVGVSLLTINPNEILAIDRYLHLIDIPSGSSSLIATDQILPVDGDLQIAGTQNNEVYLYGQHGIYKFDVNKRDLSLLYQTSNNIVIRAACIDNDQSLWVSTTSSFYRLSSDFSKAETIDLELQGTVTSIVNGVENQLWLGAGDNLLMLDKTSGKIHRVGKSEGIMPNEYYRKATGSINRHVLMGGATGLVHIRKSVEYENKVPVELFVNDIKINGKQANQEIISDFKNNATINLPWNYGLLQFYLVIKENDLFKDKIIQYKFEGFSDQFIETNDQRISVIGLSHGEYQVQIKVIGEDGLWTPAQTVMKLNVRPPWWLSWWFKIIIFVVVVSLFFVVWYILHNRHLVQIQQREKKLNDQKITFITNISHEIRTPLSLIYGPLELLLKENKDKIQRFDLLELVYKQANYLKYLVEQVLDFEKAEGATETLQLSRVHLKNWLNEVLDSLQFELKKFDIKVAFKLDEAIDEVVLDKKALTKVIYNIVINVTKYAPDTNTLTIATERVNNEFYRVSFTDEGQGILEGNEEKLFDRFFQRKSSQEGYGIGLAYAKMLIKKHNGTIAVTNVKPNGACFYFDLPFNLQESNVTDEHEAVWSETTSSKKEDYADKQVLLGQLTMLIVEDNTELLNYTNQLFKDLFKKVITARNGQEGLDKAISALPDIILSDVMMPVMDGHVFCRKVKSNIEISHIPVVLLTARQDEASLKQGYKMGADAYLIKPFSNDVLIDAIYNILLGRMRLKENYKASVNTESSLVKLTTSNADEKFIKKINQIIKEELGNPNLNVDFLVDKMAISRASLYAKFKSIVGVGINTYINDYRLSEAKILLEKTDYSMLEIAEIVGFQTQSYFSTLFKEQFDTTPLKYRQNCKK
jgi:signal transduction histidine kinase/ligand-binding sensor domain-containing protein/CheY-like chemotaxis protein